MGVELPLCVVVTILECCVTFSGVKLSIRSFVLFIFIDTDREMGCENVILSFAFSKLQINLFEKTFYFQFVNMSNRLTV